MAYMPGDDDPCVMHKKRKRSHSNAELAAMFLNEEITIYQYFHAIKNSKETPNHEQQRKK